MPLRLLFLTATVAASVWVISALAPDGVREKHDPGYVDNVFASPIVIAAARLVLLSAAPSAQLCAGSSGMVRVVDGDGSMAHTPAARKSLPRAPMTDTVPRTFEPHEVEAILEDDRRFLEEWEVHHQEQILRIQRAQDALLRARIALRLLTGR